MEIIIYRKNCKRLSNFRLILDPQGNKGYSSSPSEKFTLFQFLSHHLEFWQKWKMSFISKTVRDRAIMGKFWSYLQLFARNGFPAIFDSHIKFLRKMQKRIYHGNSARYSHFDEIFDPQGKHRVICKILPKIIFPPLFGGPIEFLHKMQKRGNRAR